MTREDALAEIARIDWAATRSHMRSSSDYVPDSFKNLINANSAAEAKAAYWSLDNGVIVQGRLYEAAEKLVPAIVAALDSDLTEHARYRLTELLTEIALGVTSDEETQLGNAALGDACRRAIRSRIDVVFALLSDRDSRIRRAAIHILCAVAADASRLESAMRAVALADPDAEARSLANDCLEKLRRP